MLHILADMTTANQTMRSAGSWSGLGRVLVGFWATLGHFWGTLGRFLGTLGPIGRALVGIRVDSDLDSVGIVFLRDDRFKKAVFLPVPVKIGKAHAGPFADVDEGEDVENVRISRISGVAGSALHGNRLVDAENARIGENIFPDVNRAILPIRPRHFYHDYIAAAALHRIDVPSQ